MSKIIEYYGPSAEGEREVNRLLSLSATGREQDWEIEFADPCRIDEMLGYLEEQSLVPDVRAALFLLTLSSFEEALDAGQLDDGCSRRASRLLEQDEETLNCMRFYWLHLERSSHMEAMGSILK